MIINGKDYTEQSIRAICDVIDGRKRAYRKKYNQKDGNILSSFDLIESRFLKKMTFQQIGDKYNLSRERIRQLLGRLEQMIDRHGLPKETP